MRKGGDIFPRAPRGVQLSEAAVRRRALIDSTPAVPEPEPPLLPVDEREADVLARLAAAAARRDHTQRQLAREAAVVRELVLEASRQGVGASRLSRVLGVSHSRILKIRSYSPEARARIAERAAMFDGEGVEVD